VDSVARVITSASNPRLKLVRKLQTRRGRERLGLFVGEGEDLVEAALEAGIVPVEALVERETGAPRPLAAEPVDHWTFSIWQSVATGMSIRRAVGV
jgi:hypothetical protein